MLREPTALRAACAALALTLTAAEARAQYWTGFEGLEITPTIYSYSPDLWDPAQPIMTLGQDDYYSPVATSVPHQAQLYTGGFPVAGINDYGIPDNPNGGGKFIVGNGPAGGVFARAQHDTPYAASGCSADRWVWATDLCVTFAGTLPTAQNAGSLSVQPFPGSQSFIMLSTWVDIATATNWNADYIWFDAAGLQVTAVISDPAFQNLSIDQWYRRETVGNLVTNEIEEVRIIDLLTGTVTSFVPTGAYMEGGTAGAARPTGFRFFVGGGVAGNVIAWDNAAVLPAGAVTEIPGCGANPANSLTVTPNPTWPILGSTLTIDIDNPAGTTPSGITIGATFMSLAGDPSLPCGTSLPAPFLGNLLIDTAIGFSIFGPTPWAGPGSPVSMSFTVPSAPQLAGFCMFMQGALVDFVTDDIQLTTGAKLELGN